MDVFELSNHLFSAFIFYSTLVVIKMCLLSLLTSFHRMKNKAFANEEDSAHKVKPNLNHPDVERIRRCHLNDIETIIPFVLLGLMYVATGPVVSTAIWHFRVFTCSRFAHSIAYLVPLPQPSRALSWMTGFLINISMAVQILLKTM